MLDQNSDYDSDATYIEEEFLSDTFGASDSNSVDSDYSLSIDDDDVEVLGDGDDDDEEGYNNADAHYIDENVNAISDEEFTADSNGTEISEPVSTSDSEQSNTEPAGLNLSAHFSMELRPHRTIRRIIDVETNGGEPEITLQVTNDLNPVRQLDEEYSQPADQIDQNEREAEPHLLRGNVEPPDLSVHDVVMEVTPVSSEPVPQDASGPIIEDTARPESQPVTISENVEKSETDCRKGKRSFDDSFCGSDDGMTCSICMDSYTNAGLHRLTSLSCGHLFGQSCIERWLAVGCHGSARRCPSCNKKASKRDIRVIYAKKLVAVDTSEVERVKKLLEKAQADKNKFELDYIRLTHKLSMKDDEIKNLKKMLCEIKEAAKEEKLTNSECGSQTTQCISVMQRIELNKEGGCRVMVFNKQLKQLLISQKSPNPLFPGFGIRKVDAYGFRPGPFFFLHPKAIRDMAVHPQECDLLLSVSLDGTAKLLDVSANVIAHTYPVTERIEFEEFLSCDDDVAVCGELTEADILDSVSADPDADPKEEEETESDRPDPTVKDAQKAIEVFIS